MRPRISFKPIEALTASEDREGCLVLVDEKLAALLVRLDDRAHDPLLQGAWFSKPASVACQPARAVRQFGRGGRFNRSRLKLRLILRPGRFGPVSDRRR